MAGAHLSIPCTIVMPRGTPAIKWENVERLGAKVVFHGTNFDEAKAECERLAGSHGLTVIPPFDHPHVIAGQGTLAVEVCNQTDMSKVDAIFCAVGGGGLISGVAAYVKRIAPPHVKIIGVETYDGDALWQSLRTGERVVLDEVGLFSDGTAVRLVGEECLRVSEELIDGVVRVSNDEICAAIKDVFEGEYALRNALTPDTRSITEPAGALAVAGMKRYIALAGEKARGKRFVSIVCGANMNFSRLRFVAERAELGEEREVLLTAELPEEPGSFMKLYNVIAPRDITEFSYRYSDGHRAQVYLAFILGGKLPENAVGASPVDPSLSPRDQEVKYVLEGLEAEGLGAADISSNELAKAHARYFVGGRENVPDERLFRFGACILRPRADSRIPRAAWCATPLPRGHRRRLEHLALPLPQPWWRHRQGACGNPSASGQRCQVRPLPARFALQLRGGDTKCRVPAIHALRIYTNDAVYSSSDWWEIIARYWSDTCMSSSCVPRAVTRP